MASKTLLGTPWRRIAAGLAIAQLLALPLAGQIVTDIPRGSAVMIDGKLSPGEWSDAQRMNLADGIDLLIKRHERFLLLAIVFPHAKYGFTDLIFNGTLDLHASAKLGERTRGVGNAWPEWSWWNNDRWTANVARVEEFAGPRLLSENIREYQIDLDRFPGKEIRLEVLSTIMNNGHIEAERHSKPLTFRLE